MIVRDYLYAIRGAGMIKIGRSVSPELRFKAIQSGSPVRLELVGYVKGDHAQERRMHRKFKEYRSHGEWFRDEGAVSEWVESVRFSTRNKV